VPIDSLLHATQPGSIGDASAKLYFISSLLLWSTSLSLKKQQFLCSRAAAELRRARHPSPFNTITTTTYQQQNTVFLKTHENTANIV
jgi:hypothetical protein